MDDQTRSVVEIEADIAETRSELTETLEAIQERLTPANIAANARETVRSAATEKVREMTDNKFMDAVRANPIPSAMIGIGAAWLYFKGRSNSGNGYRASSSNDWSTAQGYNSGAYGSGGGSYAVGTRGAGSYGGTTRTDEGVSDRVSSMGRDVASRTREVADDVRDTTRRAQLKFSNVLRDNPLMLGAAAALIGAAVGMSIPSTETENQLMGEARDAVVERAQSAASDAANQVSQAATTVQKAAGSVADTASNVGSGAPSRPEGSGSTQS